MHQTIQSDNIIHYADDTAILHTSTEEDIRQEIIEIFNQLNTWLLNNFMFLNYSKTKIMFFKTNFTIEDISYHGNIIESVSTFKYL